METGLLYQVQILCLNPRLLIRQEELCYVYFDRYLIEISERSQTLSSPQLLFRVVALLSFIICNSLPH